MTGISPETSRRIANCSFVCALLVVAIHLTNPPPDWVKLVVARVAVPFFFLVSGYFLARHVGEQGWWPRAIKRRMKTLVIPFVVWCAVPFLLFTLLLPDCSTAGECPRIALKFSSIAAAFGCHLLTLPEVNRALWFVRALFFLMLVSPAVVWAVRRYSWAAVALFGVVYLAFNPGLHGTEGFWVGVRGQVFAKFVFSVEGLFYFSSGICLALHPVSLRRRTLAWSGTVGLALCAVGYAAVAGCGALSETATAYLSAATIPFVMGLMWVAVPGKAWPKALTGNAFALYVMHPVVLKALDESHLLPTGHAAFAIEWLAAVVLSLVLAESLRRLSAKTADFVFGGR